MTKIMLVCLTHLSHLAQLTASAMQRLADRVAYQSGRLKQATHDAEVAFWVAVATKRKDEK